jgi:hypothetical protein
MIAETIRTLYRYNPWANARVLDTAERLGAEQFVTAHDAASGTIRDTLVHTMSAHWIWLERWQGRSPAAVIDAQNFPDLARSGRAGPKSRRTPSGSSVSSTRRAWLPPSNTGIRRASVGRTRSGSK